MELTQEYFDKGIANVLDKIGGVESRVAKIESTINTTMATKEDLKSLESRVIGYTHQSFEAQQTWMDHRFDELIVKYDVRERVSKLELEVKQLKLRH